MQKNFFDYVILSCVCITLHNALQADLRLEDDTIDKIYAELSKNELWGIVERYTPLNAFYSVPLLPVAFLLNAPQ